MRPDELADAFHRYVVDGVGEDGWPLSPAWILNQSGELTVMALDLNPEQAYKFVLHEAIKQDAAAFIFAIDRFAKEGQGTTRSDLLAGHLSVDGMRGVKPFIIEYDPKAGIVDPMNFDNSYWYTALRAEMVRVASLMGIRFL